MALIGKTDQLDDIGELIKEDKAAISEEKLDKIVA